MVEKGLRSKRGRRPSLSAFREMLGNPFYAGYVGLGGHLYAGLHEALTSKELLREIHSSMLDESVNIEACSSSCSMPLVNVAES